ncbi:hypothetical protein MRX96_042511 [Rhipicephalus microplus]
MRNERRRCVLPLATTWTNSGTEAPPFATTVAAAAGIKTVQSRLRSERPACSMRVRTDPGLDIPGVDWPASSSFGSLFVSSLVKLPFTPSVFLIR